MNTLLVNCLIFLGVLNELVDLLIREAELVIHDADFSFLVGVSLVVGGDFKDAVVVFLKFAFDDGLTGRSGSDSFYFEFTQEVVILNKFPLALINFKFHFRLIISNCGVLSFPFAWHLRVSWDYNIHNATFYMSPERKRCHIDQDDVSIVFYDSVYYCSLDSGAICHGLIGIDRFIQLLSSKKALDNFSNLGDTG